MMMINGNVSTDADHSSRGFYTGHDPLSSFPSTFTPQYDLQRHFQSMNLSTLVDPSSSSSSSFLPSVDDVQSNGLARSSPSMSTFTPAASSLDRTTNNDEDPSLEYLHYSMDSLIERLVPTDSYIPKQTFIYPILLCSRMNIRPSFLFNQLARSTIQSISTMTLVRSLLFSSLLSSLRCQ